MRLLFVAFYLGTVHLGFFKDVYFIVCDGM